MGVLVRFVLTTCGVFVNTPKGVDFRQKKVEKFVNFFEKSVDKGISCVVS